MDDMRSLWKIAPDLQREKMLEIQSHGCGEPVFYRKMGIGTLNDMKRLSKKTLRRALRGYAE